MSKFVYANGTPELQPPAKIASPSQGSGSGSGSGGSVVSTSSRLPTNRNSTNANALRPTSPIKPFGGIKTGNSTNIAAPLVSPRSPVAPIRPRNRQSSWGKSTDSLPTISSLQSSRSRPKSLTIAEPPVVAKLMSGGTSDASSAATSPSEQSHQLPDAFFNPASSGFASLLQAAEDFADVEGDDEPESHNSPTKQQPPQEKEVTDLVANARRERKVQDLQITNASLEAINRTLERQLRKQTAELRRFKRLSRSGRLSLASLGGSSSRVPPGSAADGGGLASAGMDLNDLSEEDGEMDEEEAESDEESEIEDDDDLSGSGESEAPDTAARAEKDAKRRQRDERRLQVDLSKHQQLLIDSQKINQSIRRCLGWTEELIKEGKKALAYQVTLGESELGGRVLTAGEIGGRVLTAEEIESRDREEEEETNTNVSEAEYRDELSRPDSPMGDEDSNTEGDENDGFWSKDPLDRDSGIELPADGG